MAEKKLVMLVLGVIGIILLLTAIKAENQGNSYFNFTFADKYLHQEILTQSGLIPFEVCNLQNKAQVVFFETIASRFPFDIQIWEEKQITSNVIRMNQVCNSFVEWISNSSFTGNFTNPNCSISYYNSTETSTSLIPFTKTTLAPNKKNHRNTTQNQNTCKNFYYKIIGIPANKRGQTQYNITILDDENNSLTVDPWFNNSWSNKRQINISGDIPMNYTLLVEIAKPDGMNATCTDARFVNSTEDGELGYWLDPYPCNSTTLKAYVRIDNNQSIYLYYNNTAVNTTSKMRNAFLVGDDFDDYNGTAYNITNATNYYSLAITNGELRGVSTDNNWFFWNNTLNFMNYTIYSKGKIQLNGFGILFRMNLTEHRGYYWDMHAGVDTIFLYNQSTGTASSQMNTSAFVSYYDTYYNFTITVNGTNLNYSAINSNLSTNSTGLVVINNTYILNTSRVGIRASFGGGENITTDYFYVVPMLTPEPTLTIGGSTASADISNPSLNITYPRNLSYNINVSVLNYTVSDDNLQACWFSSNNGLNNQTITCGVNMTGVNSTQGTNTWRIYVNDSSNNKNETNVTFVVDTIAPDVNITYPRNLSYNINVSILNYTVSTEAQSCRFSSNNGLNNQTITCGVNMSGVNSTQGSNTWRVYVNDSAGNNNESNVTFVVDTIAPDINITYPINLSYNINVSNLNYTVSTEAQSCRFSSNNGLTNQTLTCGVNMSGVNSTQGSNTWRIYVNDSAGNNNESNVTFVVDTIIPDINITYPRNLSYNINVSILNYTVSDDNLQACWFSSNNGLTNLTLTCGVNMSGVNSTQGTNTWRIYINDSAGNSNQSNVTFVVDTYAPNITIAYPTNNSNHSTRSVNINFSVSSDAQACLYTNTSGIVNYSINCGLNITNQSWNEGTNNVTIYVNDSAGNLNASSVRFIVDVTNPQINLTYPLNQTYTINVSFLNYTASDENLQSCIFSFDNGITNRSITCGINISGANSTIGSNTWLVGANDSVNNLNFSRVTFYMDNSNPNVSLTSPVNNTNSTNLTQTFTCNSSDNALRNISLWIWNSSRTNILNTTTTISGSSNTTSWNYTFARYDDYEWNCLAYDTLDNSNWSSSNSTLRLILNNISISNFTWFSRDFVFNNTLIANCSSGNNTRVTAAYFGVRNPAGISVINYVNGSSSYSTNMWNSTYFIQNQTGLWQTNVTCESSYGNTTTSFLNFSVLYDLSINPTNRNFTATQDKNEPKSFLVYLYDNSSASINLSITTAIINSSNFTITTPATITLNASDSVSNQFTFNFSINASPNVPRGVYRGNITIANSSHNISERIDFIYAVNPPSGVPTIYTVGNIVCTGNDTDTCKNNIVMTTKDPEIRAYRVNNTGFNALTDCSPRFSEGSSLASVNWITYNVTSFNLSIGVHRDMEIKFSPNTAGSFDGRFEIYCQKADLGDNPATSTNNPVNILSVSQFVSGAAGGSGGGAEPPKIIEQIPAVALIKYADDAGSYTGLQRAQIYSAIYGYCVNLTKGKCVLTDLQVLELQGTLKSKYGIEISTEQVRWWLSQYNNNMIETIQLNKLEVNKWGLRSAIVEVEELKFEVNPSRFDRAWLSITSNTFEGIVTSNKVLKEAKIVEGEGFSVSIIGNTTAKITYKIEPYPPEWTSKILTAKVNYIDEKGNSVFQDIAIRAFRLSFKSILITALPIILIGGVLIFAYRKRVEIKEYFMRFRK